MPFQIIDDHIEEIKPGLYYIRSDYVPRQGDAGKSAYEIAVDNGFTGDEGEWLDSLKNDQGINVMDIGVTGDGETDDTILIQSLINIYNSIYFPQGTYLISSISIPSNKKILTDGFLTVFQQKPGIVPDTRIINIVGSNVELHSCTVKGNIDTDPGEQRHGVHVYADSDSGNIRNVTIHDIVGENLRGDAVYVGNHNTGETVENVKIGSVFGDNVYRNVVSITGGSDIYIHSITGSAVGLIMFDIEPNLGCGKVKNVTLNYCKGHSAYVVPPSESDQASGIKINHMDLNPAHCDFSTPAFYNRGSYANDGLILRNTQSILFDYLKIEGFNRMGILALTEPGDLGVKSLVINYLEILDCAKTDTTYYAYFLGHVEPVIRHLKVSCTRNNVRVFDSLTGGVLDHVEYTFSEATSLLRNSVNVIVNNLDATGTIGGVLVSCQSCVIYNANVNAAFFASYSHKLCVKNSTIVCSSYVFNSNYTDHFIENSTLNNEYYSLGFYIRNYQYPFRFGNHTIWIDTNGVLRVKNGLPVNDTDGTIVEDRSKLVTAFQGTPDHTHYPSEKLLHDQLPTSGSGSPSSTPTRIGLFYIDTANSKLYFSKGTSSSSDWIIAN